METTIILILSSLVVLALVGVLYACCAVSGRITESERRAYWQKHGHWPEW